MSRQDELRAALLGISLAAGIPAKLLPELRTSAAPRRVLNREDQQRDAQRREIDEWNAAVDAKKKAKKGRK